jgi:predicted dehydrogenase
MKTFGEVKAAVVGVGFIGIVHVEALRRLGIEVVGVCAESREIAQKRALSYPLPRVYDDLGQLLEDPAVDVVHIATPNQYHYSQVKQVLAAGKHVICEKPLGLDSRESAELVELAERSGLVHCTNFNVRFYPQVHEARQRVAMGQLGEVWNVHGAYLQDWLLYPTDWNWRVEPDIGGRSRAVGDIGSHWLDTVQFIAGRRVTAVMAELFTALPLRRRPVEDVQTYEAGDGATEEVAVSTEDVAHLMLRLEGGAHGSAVISQVSAGRRNLLALEVDGSQGSLSWSTERHEELWLGHRDRPNEVLLRDPGIMLGDLRGSLPGGHSEGFQDASKELYRAVYQAVAAGKPSDDYPTFHDGHWENVLVDAVWESSSKGRWVEVAWRSAADGGAL